MQYFLDFNVSKLVSTSEYMQKAFGVKSSQVCDWLAKWLIMLGLRI